MKRSLVLAVAAVGFISALITIIQSFSFKHLERVEMVYSCYPATDNTVFEFLDRAHANVGSVVWLDARMCSGVTGNVPFERNVANAEVTWQFDPCTVAAQVNRQCAFYSGDPNAHSYWQETKRQLSARLSRGDRSYDDVEDHLVDNGTRVTIRGVGQDANPFTSFEIDTEGTDVAYGPFQISMSNRDGNRHLWLSPAPYSGELAKQVRCVRRNWSALVKFLVCPFF